jgi:ABC-type polysaccharide/polyol phosphate transport system ATPase subunit
MVARLGFAVATAWQPEILILDEVLAVGDEAFRAKCQARMQAFRANGTTTLLVAHDMNTVQSLCTRAAWLDHGRIMTLGDVKEVVQQYRAGGKSNSGKEF